MRTVDRYLVRQFVPVFLVGLLLFVLLLQLVDLFANLWKYLSYDTSALDILKVALLYTPKCVSYALPVSLLFAAAYVLGELYARNELIIFFTSGVPLRRLALSFFVIGSILSVLAFQFEDRIVIASLRQKKDLSGVLLRQRNSGSDSDIVVKADEGRLVYSAEYYNDAEKTLNNLTIVERNRDGAFNRLIQARRARWNDGAWDLENAVSYRWFDDRIVYESYGATKEFDEPPDTFRRNALDVSDLRSRDAEAYIDDLRRAGFPVESALADYYKRFAFAATPFVVMLLSVAVGGRFRKNVLLMSLLASLVVSVIYYVIQMLTMLMAKLGYVSPVAGAWAPAVIFILLSAALIAKART